MARKQGVTTTTYDWLSVSFGLFPVSFNRNAACFISWGSVIDLLDIRPEEKKQQQKKHTLFSRP